MSYIELKYINILSGRLSQFKRKSENLFNFRCPFCGDSQTNKLKARGYIYSRENKFSYKCHNCGITSSIGNLIKHVDETMFKEYRTESFMDTRRSDGERQKNKSQGIVFDKRKYHFKTPLKILKQISQLSASHPAKLYVVKRKIPNKYHRKLYYAPYFAKFVNTLIPRKLPEQNDEPRLLIPFFDEYENLMGFQGRSFDPKSKLKYITIMLDESKPKIFGLEDIDWNKKVYVVEGPIDSMFIQNSIAMAGADGGAYINSKKKNVILIYDNESKSSEIIKKISKNIDDGFSVCIWPNYLKQKDINDMILSGMTEVEISNIINDNTFDKLEAKTKLSEWRKT